MFFLHASNRTENLLKHLAAIIEADPQDSPFAKEYIVIQSQGVERMICQTMALHFTSWCNYTFSLPLGFLQDIAVRLGMQVTPDAFERSHLCWRIESALHCLEESVYAPLRHYLDDENQAFKRYQLARHLANVFDQYQLMRPDMLKSWEHGICCTEKSAEQWQMHLWNRLVKEPAVGKPRGDLLQTVIKKLKTTCVDSEKSGILPKRVSIFGLHILPPFFLDYVESLSRHCDVHLFLLSPCKNYWGNMFRSTMREARGAHTQTSHPLLESLGKQGRDFQELLLDKVDFYQEITSYEDPLDETSPLLLHRLQSDLLNGQNRTQSIDNAGDDSLRVVSCHSKVRELEVLKDHILALLNGDPGIALRDIVVMAPDIQGYAPFIPAIFSDIDHSIADKGFSRKNQYVSVFKEFLHLFRGRFGWSEVLDILGKELVYLHFGISSNDLEIIQHWVVSSGIRWGLSRKSREAEGFAFATNSWQSGLDRMLMGYAIDTEQSVAGILPYTAIEGSDGAILGRLCEFVDIIYAGARDFAQAHGLGQWSKLFMTYLERLFGQQDNRDFLELVEIVHKLKNYASHHQSKVALDVILDWLENSAAESRSTSGFLTGRLTFCSMLPMRSIPFTAVCLLGLNYDVFPKNDHFQTFDLMKYHPQRGDRSSRADDRYQFLEAILSTRQVLYISYVGQSLINNETIPPSVVVSELLDSIYDDYRFEDVVEIHPLHGCSRQYFTPNSALYSYNQENLEIAKNFCRDKESKKKWWSGKLDVEIKEVALSDFVSFFTQPQRYFVQNCVGLQIRKDEVLPDEGEIFGHSPLQAYHADELILTAIRSDNSGSIMFRRLQENGVWPLGNPGELIFEQKTRELSAFTMRLQGLDLGKRLEDREFCITVGSTRLHGNISNVFTNGVLLTRYAKLKGKDLLTWWIYHLITEEIGLDQTRVYLVLKDVELLADSRQKLPGSSLRNLVDVYLAGLAEPSPLFIQPGIDYCRQKMSATAKISPLHKARQTFRHSLENEYEPYWSLLFQGCSADEVIGENFVAATEEILMPLWRLTLD